METTPDTVLFRTTDVLEAAMLHEALEASGIPTLETGGHGIRAIAGARHEALYTELWVPHHLRSEAARVVESCLHARSPVAPLDGPWTCATCAESNDAGFEICWKCCAARSA